MKVMVFSTLLGLGILFLPNLAIGQTTSGGPVLSVNIPLPPVPVPVQPPPEIEACNIYNIKNSRRKTYGRKSDQPKQSGLTKKDVRSSRYAGARIF